jgi:hypothetical protein
VLKTKSIDKVFRNTEQRIGVQKLLDISAGEKAFVSINFNTLLDKSPYKFIVTQRQAMLVIRYPYAPNTIVDSKVLFLIALVELLK